MDSTPTRVTRSRTAEVNVLEDELSPLRDQVRGGRIRKPPPITPRRFNKFFTPRPRNELAAPLVKTSRKALRSISSSNLNTRRQPNLQPDVSAEYLSANENNNPRKKRKFSIISSTHSTPYQSSVSFLPSSQDALPSSPIKYGRDTDDEDVDVDSDVSTDIDEASWSLDEDEDIPTGPSMIPYQKTSISHTIFSRRLGSSRRPFVSDTSSQWQHETCNFYSKPEDVNHELRNRQPSIIPFSMAACKTNPIVATGDEEGIIRFLNTTQSDKGPNGFPKSVLEMQPHDNAIMDLVFSDDDYTIATASGDQTCQVLDVATQRSLYSLRAHTASVKRVEFQPGSGGKVLASTGRDGTICLWDTRLKGQSLSANRKTRVHVTDMAQDMAVLSPVLEIFNAHKPISKSTSTARKGRQNVVAARNDFSITSLSFIDSSRNNFLATASEVDTVIKLWDLRQSQLSARKKGHSQIPVSMTQEPHSHEIHRKFGINSLALSTDRSRIFALSRDHTVYAYSTSHIILGTNPELDLGTSTSRKTMAPMRTESNAGIGPIYGFRHPALRVATFWPRLSIRKSTASNTEILAVASTDDCTVLFPTSEKYHTKATKSIPLLHDPTTASSSTGHSANDTVPTSRPNLRRAPTTSFTSLFTPARLAEDALPIYYHGTPLVHGHSKEVTSVAWSSEGNLVTTSDDFTVRCWREDANEARNLRELKKQNDAGSLLKHGWAHVGVEGWDDED